MNKTNWHFYTNTEDTWKALKEALLNAHKSIVIEQYILEPDEIGREFLEILIKKRKGGVNIRLLCDMVGSYNFFASSMPYSLQEIGIEVRFFNIIKPWRVHNFLSWFFRDHRKLIVVDSAVGFVGGVNMRIDTKHWRDTHVRVRGTITKEMQFAFEEMWVAAGEKKFFKRLKSTKRFVKGFQFITNSPYLRKRYLYQEIVRAMREAKRYIHITTPYFIPDRRIRRVLRLASNKGVDVRIIIPETSDVPIVDIASGSYYEKLLSSGVKIYKYKGAQLHAKTTVVDDDWATVGSFNMDSMSFLYDYEANIVSTNIEFSSEVENHFQNDLKNSDQITLSDWKYRPYKRRVQEMLTLPIRRFL